MSASSTLPEWLISESVDGSQHWISHTCEPVMFARILDEGDPIRPFEYGMATGQRLADIHFFSDPLEGGALEELLHQAARAVIDYDEGFDIGRKI